ncbi:L-histidine N(alpha)-methyltransferase [Mucilaginibacter sabulilitoris]|uniref:L-histidine N(Alpha)-methyltransferase n=1 Tax=Mucilaginibacter sabulilitoris TaxID=1173583 RepID=A0ABZ0TPT7_9SPHI|nr:L-histidine N(alpha)-methyltransferase [Mucilaginibacter sabulilitoris]WPU94791.1 L-histidine N(alpha)-methyltransferase [Mucilaginibacter sabulilitoris]
MLAIKQKRPRIIKTETPVIRDVAFYQDVVNGLTSEPKQLQSKYFYDKEGDRLFQQIMNCSEYYPFQCELEIFSQQTEMLANVIAKAGATADLIELGAGDCTKTRYLLAELVKMDTDFTYLPIDISENIIDFLNAQLPLDIPGLKVNGITGDYLQMLGRAADHSDNKKVVLFLGSNIGNMSPGEAAEFCMNLRQHLKPGDLVIIGVDLKKKPATILAAYNDKAGITKEFNLNLLRRINRELGANFEITQFEHYPVYDPDTGGCKSYLISLKKQQVMIPCVDGSTWINFEENEPMFMEISQKYSIKEIEELGRNAQFRPVANFFDNKGWFMDTVWEAV